MKISYIALVALAIALLPCIHAEEDSAEPRKRMSYAERLRLRREAMAVKRSTRAVDLLRLLRQDKRDEVIERLEQEIDSAVCSAWQHVQTSEAGQQWSAMAFLRKMNEYRTEYPAGSSGDQAAEAKRILDEIESTDTVEPAPAGDDLKAAPEE